MISLSTTRNCEGEGLSKKKKNRKIRVLTRREGLPSEINHPTTPTWILLSMKKAAIGTKRRSHLSQGSEESPLRGSFRMKDGSIVGGLQEKPGNKECEGETKETYTRSGKNYDLSKAHTFNQTKRKVVEIGLLKSWGKGETILE